MPDNLITFRILCKETCQPILALSPRAAGKLPQLLVPAAADVLERGSGFVGNDLLALRIFSEKLTPGVPVILTVPGTHRNRTRASLHIVCVFSTPGVPVSLKNLPVFFGGHNPFQPHSVQGLVTSAPSCAAGALQALAGLLSFMKPFLCPGRILFLLLVPRTSQVLGKGKS